MERDPCLPVIIAMLMVVFSGVSMPRHGDNMKYIFKQNGDSLDFVGDFESLYKNDNDPWGQSGKNGEMSHYYAHSRKRLIEQLKKIKPKSLLETGCGLGYATKNIQESLPECNVIGVDISKTAIVKAAKLFPNLNFETADIRNANIDLNLKYDVIILNQLLWYVLEFFSETLENCFSLLNPEGKIIISQAFLKTPQKYGTDICDGFDGLIEYLTINNFDIEYYNLDNSNSYVHNDGLVIFKKQDGERSK